MTSLVQIARADGQRRVALVRDQTLVLLQGCSTIYQLAQAALDQGIPLPRFAATQSTAETLDYDAIYQGRGDWRILPVVDHPADAARLLVSGTGLTHQRSADQRQAMHAADAAPTDSLRMYEWGVSGGRPEPGSVGAAPEWFYKGNGTILHGHGDTLQTPAHADDGGEEPEIVGVYLIDSAGTPRRIGMAIGNEFADHILEKRNYLYLAASKLRNCAVGPELVVDADFTDVPGTVTIERNGSTLWTRAVHTGEKAMCHSLQNLEHHHFKFEGHRRPGDLHVHFFGADAFSFGAGLVLEHGDIMQIHFEGFGRPLRNPLAVDRSAQMPVTVNPV